MIGPERPPVKSSPPTKRARTIGPALPSPVGSAAPVTALPTVAPPEPPAAIGPIPPSAAVSGTSSRVGVETAPKRAVIGPAPPTLVAHAIGPARPLPPTSGSLAPRKLSPEKRGRAVGAKRDGWMVDLPSVTPVSQREFGSRRGFSKREVSDLREEDRATWTEKPGETEQKQTNVGASSLQLEEGEESSESEGEADDATWSKSAERGGASLLQQHQNAREGLAREGPGVSTFRPWDRESEFVVNHKKTDAASFLSKHGSLGSRYAAPRR